MEDPNELQQKILQNYKDNYDLQQAQLEALKQAFGNYKNFRYVDLEDFLDPDNQNWRDYTYKVPGYVWKLQGRVGAGTPIGTFIEQLRDAKTIDDVKKQQELWDLYKPLDTDSGRRDYVRYFTTGGYQGSNAPYGGSRPVFPTTNESDPVQTTATTTGGAQDVKTGNAVAKGGIQGTNGSGGTYATAGVAKGGTKTIGYDPNPGNISLAYAMRNAPEQERRAALIDKWNREHGRSSSTYTSPSISTGGTYATGQGMLTSGSNGSYSSQSIKDANGNVLTNPGEIGNINMLLEIHNMD